MRARLKAVVLALTTLFLASTSALAGAADAPRFALGVGGAFLRDRPALTSTLTGPVFAGQTYVVTARTPDGTWLQLAPPSGPPGWLLSSLGQSAGDLAALPVVTPARVRAQARSAQSGSLRHVISPITPSIRKKYRDAVKAGRSPGMFAVVGDCNSEPDAYWWRLAAGTFDVSVHQDLHAVVERFAWSFTRGSAAAKGGFHSASMFEPIWANPAECGGDEGPLDCELRRSNASVAFISLGTGDTFAWRDFEANYARIIERAIERKVVPILVTKADDLESQQAGAPPGAINDAVRRLGQRYGVPVIDFWQATRALPEFGMRWEGNENFHMSAAGSDLRIVLSLQALDALTR
jgi:hypothetical protein